MSIVIDSSTRVIVQGITGNVGRVMAERMSRHYRTFVGGVTPGKGGSTVSGVPVFNSVREAAEQVGANASAILVPALFLKEAVLEALASGIKVLWIYSDGVPLHDSLTIISWVRHYGARLIGPNSAGIVSPGKASLSELSEDQIPLREGEIGFVSKSGSLTYEAVEMVSRVNGFGQSSVACLGGDTVLGTSCVDILRLFEVDPQTKAVVLLGEVGGSAEVEAADFIKTMTKPVFAYISGRCAPAGKRMGHAGAIINRAGETAESKSEALSASGAHVASSIFEVPSLIAKTLG